MLKQKFFVQKLNGKIEFLYDLFYSEKGEVITLRRSLAGTMWTKEFLGKNAVTLENNGNGFSIKTEYLTLVLDYSEADYVYQALKFHYALYRKTRPKLKLEERVVSKLSDLDHPKTVKKAKPDLKDILAAIEEMDEEEILLVKDAANGRLVDRGWEWGDILGNLWSWLNVHAPGAREEYVDGSAPQYFYGAPELLKKEKND